MSKSKQKGYRGEVQAVKALNDCGFDARRIFGSGAFENILGKDFAGDIALTLPADCLTGEVKVRAAGFKQLYGWLDDGRKDFLMVKADRMPWLMVLPMDTVTRVFGAENTDPEDNEE